MLRLEHTGEAASSATGAGDVAGRWFWGTVCINKGWQAGGKAQ